MILLEQELPPSRDLSIDLEQGFDRLLGFSHMLDLTDIKLNLDNGSVREELSPSHDLSIDLRLAARVLTHVGSHRYLTQVSIDSVRARVFPLMTSLLTFDWLLGFSHMLDLTYI